MGNNNDTTVIHGPYAQKYGAKLFDLLWCHAEVTQKCAVLPDSTEDWM